MPIPYSRKYWQELNLAVGPKIAIAKMLADLNWLFGKGLTYVYMQVRNISGFNLAVAKKVDCQISNLISPPNFATIWYLSPGL